MKSEAGQQISFCKVQRYERIFFGRERTIFPIHTEDRDMYSVNRLHHGAPTVWYVIAQDDYTRACELIAEACKGNVH